MNSGGSTLTVSCFMQDHWTRASGVRGTAGCNLERSPGGVSMRERLLAFCVFQS